MNKEIFEKLKDILADKLALDLEEINEDSHFQNDLGADSIDAVEVVIEVERHFNIYISDDKLENIALAKELVDLIERETNL
jgi:acyl carrier protein